MIKITIDAFQTFALQNDIETTEECLIQTGRVIGNLCYYNEANTKRALEDGCLSITTKLISLNHKQSTQFIIIGLLMNLTHLHEYEYEFPDNMTEELNSFGVSNMNYKFNCQLYFNLVSVLINVVQKSAKKNDISKYEKCSIIDWLLENHSSHSDIAYICIKFIKTVSKTSNNYCWILNGKHKIMAEVLNVYEEKLEEDTNQIIKKICNTIVLLSNDDSAQEIDKRDAVLYLVEWLIIKMKSKNVYIQVSAIRSLGNFARFNYECGNDVYKYPANLIESNMGWFLDILINSGKEKSTVLAVSILCLFKNILYVSSFGSLHKNEQKKLVNYTIEILNETSTSIPIILKILDVIECIIRKNGLDQEHLKLYQSPDFNKQVKRYCDSPVKEIQENAKKLFQLIENSC
ncbi:uncharacterized protein LOC126834310 isoform X2 [Adelges cooleyi]|nr:uncharacterized protein LOC126834310 isoform X2 [Adelges cooleyi]